MNLVKCGVKSISELTPVVYKVMLEPELPVAFKAGQYLQVVMSESDKRPFSIASAPTADNDIELHIGATPSNKYAYEVLAKLREDKEIVIEVPLGNAFRRDSVDPMIIIAGGTGYSYAKSILHDVLSSEPARNVFLYWGAKEEFELYEADELLTLTNLHPNFIFVPVLENPPSHWQGKTGWVHKAVLSDFSSFINTQVYIAGRFEMAATVRTDFCAIDLKKENLYGDAYAFI